MGAVLIKHKMISRTGLVLSFGSSVAFGEKMIPIFVTPSAAVVIVSVHLMSNIEVPIFSETHNGTMIVSIGRVLRWIVLVTS